MLSFTYIFILSFALIPTLFHETKKSINFMDVKILKLMPLCQEFTLLAFIFTSYLFKVIFSKSANTFFASIATASSEISCSYSKIALSLRFDLANLALYKKIVYRYKKRQSED